MPLSNFEPFWDSSQPSLRFQEMEPLNVLFRWIQIFLNRTRYHNLENSTRGVLFDPLKIVKEAQWFKQLTKLQRFNSHGCYGSFIIWRESLGLWLTSLGSLEMTNNNIIIIIIINISYDSTDHALNFLFTLQNIPQNLIAFLEFLISDLKVEFRRTKAPFIH